MPLITKPISINNGAISMTPPTPPLGRLDTPLEAMERVQTERHQEIVGSVPTKVGMNANPLAPVPVHECSPSPLESTAPQVVTHAEIVARNKTLWEPNKQNSGE